MGRTRMGAGPAAPEQLGTLSWPGCTGAARHAEPARHRMTWGAKGRAAGQREGREAWERSVPRLRRLAIPHGLRDSATRGPCPCHHTGQTQALAQSPTCLQSPGEKGWALRSGDGETGAGGTAGLVRQDSRAVRCGTDPGHPRKLGTAGSPQPRHPKPAGAAAQPRAVLPCAAAATPAQRPRTDGRGFGTDRALRRPGLLEQLHRPHRAPEQQRCHGKHGTRVVLIEEEPKA